MYSWTVAATAFCGLIIFTIRAPEIIGSLDGSDDDDHTYTLSVKTHHDGIEKCDDAEKVCERDEGAHLKIMDPEAEERAPCGKRNYTCTPGIGCHKLFEIDKSWNEAREACERDEAHLAVINSETEEQLLAKMLRTTRSISAWIGVHYEEKNWLTVNGQPISSAGYIHWSADSNYHKNSLGDGPTLDTDRMCVEFSASTRSGMNYVYCDYRVSYICEREIQY